MLPLQIVVFWSLCFLGFARAQVTVYGQIPVAFTQTYDPSAQPTTILPAYDETRLTPPPLPNPMPPTAFTLNLPANGANVPGLSIVHRDGPFWGFSIEMSVINQLLGKNSTHLNVPFLNLISTLATRGGRVHIRFGGNTQEFAVHVDELPYHAAVGKEKSDSRNPTQTPAVQFTTDLFYMAANISSLVNAGWYFGIPFNDTNWRLQIAELSQEILGDNLLGLQAGNEPDLYAVHHARPETYSPLDYFAEFGMLVEAINANPRIKNKNMLLGPSLSNGQWRLEQVWDTGYLTAYSQYLSTLTIETYPSNNCAAQFGLGTLRDPQQEFPNYLNHDAGRRLIGPFLNSSAIAQSLGKPFMMFETNTASCGGFPGVSNSFGAALWALDYGLTMAASNFSRAFLHIGGQNVYYNPFTAPPTNQSYFHGWTAGAVYYSVLIIAEAFGTSNASQIIDVSNNGIFNPAYSIYEQGTLARVALFNYNDDPSGNSDIRATITVSGGQVPAQVRVKYFAAQSVSDKSNLRWAGQTLGNQYEVDGRMKGSLDVTTIQCDQGANVCIVPVKAPGFALVFLTDSSLLHDEPPVTFATTAQTRTVNTVTVDPSLLATSNGISGKDREQYGSTSKGSVNGATAQCGLGFVSLSGVVVIMMAIGRAVGH